MLKQIFILLACVLFSVTLSAQQKITTFILLRHAEKADDGTKDPPLSTAGIDRAMLIAHMLGNTPVNAIYSTAYKRTQQTAEPLAKEKGITVQIYEPMKENVINEMLKKHSGETVVIFGHSNTTPWNANVLLGNNSVKDFAETEFGNMLIVTIAEPGNAQLTRINY